VLQHTWFITITFSVHALLIFKLNRLRSSYFKFKQLTLKRESNITDIGQWKPLFEHVHQLSSVHYTHKCHISLLLRSVDWLIDWLIDWVIVGCLMSSGKYTMHIQDKNNFTTYMRGNRQPGQKIATITGQLWRFE
jgi:hypothetical protein